MTTRIFVTDVPVPHGQRPDLARLMPLIASGFDDALDKAARLIKSGAVVWRIEDESRTLSEPGDVVTTCRARGLLP